MIVGTNIRILSDDGRAYRRDLTRTLGAVASDGYGSARFEWGLAAVETVPGSAEAGRALSQVPAVRPLATLTGGGSARFAGGMPLAERDVTAFRDFAAGSARSFGPAPILEIWNEWNLPTAKRPAGQVPAYLAVTRATYRAVKQANPEALVLVGAVGSDVGSGPFRPDRLTWLDSALAQRLLDASDGLSVHLYNNCGAYRARPGAEMLWRLAQIDAAVRRGTGRSHPIYVTEVGWPTRADRADCGYSAQESATQAARFLLASSALPYVGGVWLYEYEDRPGAKGQEAVFGLRASSGAPKSPTCDLAEVIAIVGHSDTRALTVEKGVYHFRATRGREAWDIYWSDTPQSVPAALANKAGSAVCGGRSDAVRSRILSGNPLIFKGVTGS